MSTDGRYGPVTARAVRLFQKRHHLSADGIVGPETYRKLTGDVMPDYKIVVHRDEKNGQCSQKQSGKKKSADSDKRNRTAAGRKALAVTKEAQKYIGIPYRFGGTDTHGFDCSGFIQYVFRQKGISLPRAADQQYRWGKRYPAAPCSREILCSFPPMRMGYRIPAFMSAAAGLSVRPPVRALPWQI